MKKIIEIIQEKWLKDTTKTIILVTMLFICFIGINILIQKLDLQDIDITKNKIFTLSEISKKQIENIDEKVTMYLVGISENTSLVDLAKQYTKQNKNIKIEVIEDIGKRADLKSKYDITDQTQMIIVETDERNKLLTIDELYTYDYTTYQQIDVSEEKLTNAICDITISQKPKIYFLTGHNEYSLNSELTILKAYLTNEINDVENLDLLVKGEIPQDADLIVIGSPQKDFIEQEVQIITTYIERGGKILWMNDPTLTEKSFPNIQKILDQFGINFQQGIILEQDENKMAMQAPNYIIPSINITKATKDIATDGGILLINASKITLAEDEKMEELNVTSQIILTTSNKALYRTQTDNTSNYKIPSDEEGNFILGVKLEKKIEEEKNSTLYAISSNFFIVDYPITIGDSQISPIYFYNNKDYILNTIAELTNKESTISIRKDTGVVTYTATQNQDKIIKIAIIIYPILIITIGFIVWYIRRRKK